VTIRNQLSLKCLAAQPQDGFAPVQFECHNRDATTKWTIVHVPLTDLPGCS
jgi:hypothetical protein